LVSVCLQLSECLTCGLAYVCIAETVEDILNPDKAGFWKSCSTCDQVAALTAYIEQVFQYQLKTGTVFLDLTVAYDTMWHTGLLVKLSKNMPVHEAVHVPVSSVVTCLGVQFDSHLTFTPHVPCLSLFLPSSAVTVCEAVCMTTDSAKTPVHALIASHLESRLLQQCFISDKHHCHKDPPVSFALCHTTHSVEAEV